MRKDLRVLLVEDSPQDADLLLRELRRGGYTPQWRRAETRDEFRAALEAQSWDLILADHALPRIGALEALAMLKERGLDVPFIIVSGRVGAQAAVAALRAGVNDVLFENELSRLVAAAERELREAAARAERRQLQERLLTAERAVSVGTLAAGVTHQLSSPSATVILGLELSLERLAQLGAALRTQPDVDVAARIAELEANLRDVHEASERVCQIARDLRSFSWAGCDDSRGPVDVERAIEAALRIAWSAIRYRARLVRSYGRVPPVLGSEPRLGQVFFELLLNAAQAIPEGALDEHEIEIRTRSEDARVAVEIRDTGSGIPADVLPRIFEPFFTTRPLGTGTGLGLTVCRQIVASLGGEIDVASRPGAGSTLRVSLPAAEPGLEVRVDRTPAAPAGVAQRRAAILVVDGDPLIGNVARRALSDEHDVATAESVADALARIAESDARYDLILCDMHLVRGTGMDLHAELLREKPQLAEKLAFTIGGALTPATREFLARVPNARLEKPFDTGALRALVRDVLGRP